jgi:hypothetical protein
MTPTSSSPSYLATAVSSVSGGAAGDFVIWICNVAHIAPPPTTVAVTIGSVFVVLGHMLLNWLSKKMGVPVPEPPKESAP